MKNGSFEPEGGFGYNTQLRTLDSAIVTVQPLDIDLFEKEIKSKGGYTDIDLSLLGDLQINYGTKLYNDVILKIQAMMSAENPRFAFNPKDRWGKVFEGGYSSVNFEGLNALEVGVGTGINIIKIIIAQEVQQIIGSDIEPDVVALSFDNIRKYCPTQAHKYTAVESNLLSQIDPEYLKKVDYVMGCVPHAVRGKNVKKNHDDTAHYYPWEYFTQYPSNKLALGLNEALLHQISQVSSQAKVLLNLAGRVGKDNLMNLFKSHGFNPEVKYEEIIPQCPSTSLDFFVKLEENGFSDCEFYSDSNGSPKKRITAKEAEKIRVNEVDAYEGNVGDLEDIGVYHSLHAIEGSL